MTPGARRDKYKPDHLDHWSPAVCELIANARAQVVAAVETEIDALQQEHAWNPHLAHTLDRIRVAVRNAT